MRASSPRTVRGAVPGRPGVRGLRRPGPQSPGSGARPASPTPAVAGAPQCGPSTRLPAGAHRDPIERLVSFEPYHPGLGRYPTIPWPASAHHQLRASCRQMPAIRVSCPGGMEQPADHETYRGSTKADHHHLQPFPPPVADQSHRLIGADSEQHQRAEHDAGDQCLRSG